MEYWIFIDEQTLGPYTLPQLRMMWEQGQLTASALCCGTKEVKWTPLFLLLDSNRQLFTAEEALVRVGQNRQKACLSIYNRDECLQIFVADGHIVCAQGRYEQGEFALSRALHLEQATYEWFFDAAPPEQNLRLNIQEYALKHAIARDVRVGAEQQKPAKKRMTNTMKIKLSDLERPESKLVAKYLLVRDTAPALRLLLDKPTLILGREDHCDVVVDDTQVSRKHCLLEVWEQHVKVKDLDSSNGTFINGVPQKDGFLNVGDQLSLGSVHLVLQRDKKRAPGAAGNSYGWETKKTSDGE